MNDKAYDLLFIGTHDPARSIMAEGLLNSLGGVRSKAHPAGSQPTSAVKAFASTTLKTMHIPSDDYRGKDWSEFVQPDAPALDFVLSVCDNAGVQVCPVWPPLQAAMDSRRRSSGTRA
jgi:arsenate reductase